jgi:hypothetical protein
MSWPFIQMPLAGAVWDSCPHGILTYSPTDRFIFQREALLRSFFYRNFLIRAVNHRALRPEIPTGYNESDRAAGVRFEFHAREYKPAKTTTIRTIYQVEALFCDRNCFRRDLGERVVYKAVTLVSSAIACRKPPRLISTWPDFQTRPAIRNHPSRHYIPT